MTLDRAALKLSKTIRTVDDVKQAIAHYCDRIPGGKVLSTTSHFSTDIRYRKVYVQVPQDTDSYLSVLNERDMSLGGISIFKDKVKE